MNKLATKGLLKRAFSPRKHKGLPPASSTSRLKPQQVADLRAELNRISNIPVGPTDPWQILRQELTQGDPIDAAVNMVRPAVRTYGNAARNLFGRGQEPTSSDPIAMPRPVALGMRPTRENASELMAQRLARAFEALKAKFQRWIPNRESNPALARMTDRYDTDAAMEGAIDNMNNPPGYSRYTGKALPRLLHQMNLDRSRQTTPSDILRRYNEISEERAPLNVDGIVEDASRPIQGVDWSSPLTALRDVGSNVVQDVDWSSPVSAGRGLFQNSGAIQPSTLQSFVADVFSKGNRLNARAMDTILPGNPFNTNRTIEEQLQSEINDNKLVPKEGE